MATINVTQTISPSTKLFVSSLNILKSAITEDSSDIKPFFVIDNIPLSEHNRTTSFSLDPKYTINSRWNGSKGIYFKTSHSKKQFNFDWKMLPGKRENTADLNSGRNILKELASDQGVHVLKIRKLDASGLQSYTEEIYNVLITSYNETLIRRDLVANEFYWDCSMTFQEV